MPSPLWICKKNEIASHIRKLFVHYGEDESFFNEYLTGVLEHDIDAALRCFRELTSQLEWLPKIKPAHKEVTNEQAIRYQAPFNPWTGELLPDDGRRKTDLLAKPQITRRTYRKKPR